MTLQCLTIKPVKDEQGNPIIPPRDYTTGMASRPKQFRCNMEPRNAALIDHSISILEDE